MFYRFSETEGLDLDFFTEPGYYYIKLTHLVLIDGTWVISETFPTNIKVCTEKNKEIPNEYDPTDDEDAGYVFRREEEEEYRRWRDVYHYYYVYQGDVNLKNFDVVLPQIPKPILDYDDD